MTREIYVQRGAQRELAVVEDGRLVEYLRENPESSGAENVYLGRVERVVTGMNAAFVDIGQERNGFLPLEERSTAHSTRLQCGMRILVQVKKEAQGTKGAFLTRDITLCGQYALLMPCNRYIGVSSRVEDAQDKEALRTLGRDIAGEAFGLVMRHASLEAEESEIRAEIATMLEAWKQLESKAATAPAPSLIYQPRTLLHSLLDDYLPRGIQRVVTDDEALQIPGCEVSHEPPGVMARHGLTIQRDKALRRLVWLDGGGNLMIDPCEALTVIDVNTAKNTGKRALEQTVLLTNLEAAEEIARQVRLRNLSGIILIDMIDMQEEAHREAVLAALTEAFRADRVKTVIHGLTSLGLVEMTRKKTRRPLRDDWTHPCETCRGTGRVPMTEEENHG